MVQLYKYSTLNFFFKIVLDQELNMVRYDGRKGIEKGEFPIYRPLW